MGAIKRVVLIERFMKEEPTNVGSFFCTQTQEKDNSIYISSFKKDYNQLNQIILKQNSV